MSQNSLQITSLVTQSTLNQERLYQIRPLFLPYPVIYHERFDEAIKQFKQEFVQYYKGRKLSRFGYEELFWLQFDPGVEILRYQLSFNLNRQFISGRFTVLRFRFKDKQYLVFPAFNHHICLLPDKAKSKAQRKEEALRIIQKLLAEQKENDPDQFDPADYFSSRREFVTHIDLQVRIHAPDFSFVRNEEDAIFRLFRAQEEFDGETELEKVGYELNSLFPESLQRAYYREERVQNLLQLLFAPPHVPIVLVGEEGVGKKTLIQEALYRYLQQIATQDEVEAQRIWQIDPTRIIAGMSVVGMWEKRLEAILEYAQQPRLQDPRGDILLFDNPLALLRIGQSSQNDLTVANVLKTYLQKRAIQVILLARPEEWKILQERNRSFAEQFRTMRIYPSTEEQSVRMVIQQRRQLEFQMGCEITIQAIQQIFQIHRNFLQHRALPGGVIQMLRQLAAKHRFSIVDAPEVRAEFQFSSGLDERIFDETQRFSAGQVRQALGNQLIGQEDAVDALTDTVHLVKAKLTNPDRPFSSYLFIGPTGVGKTQAAKVLAEYLMGPEAELIRFDMNEFIDPFAIQRLIGDYRQPDGLLTSKVRYQPYGVLLLDEIEKAHPTVLDLLLQILDDGRLTDSRGRTVDFSNLVIIMTSNLGADKVQSTLGFTPEKDIQGIYLRAVEGFFRPELINRIDRIIIFNALQPDHILRIARLQIRELLRRDGFVRRTTILNISEDALRWVATRGYDARMGGRALRRQIERDLTALSAEQLINNQSDQPILFEIDLEEDHLVPKITPLSFAKRLPQAWIIPMPEARHGHRFYRRLIQQMERLEQSLNQVEDQISYPNQTGASANEENWEFYHVKNKVAELKEKLQTLSLGFQDQYFNQRPAIPFRLKSTNSSQRKGERKSRAEKVSFRDRLFQQEALEEMQDQYQYAAATFDSLKTEFLQNLLEVALVQRITKRFLEGAFERVQLRLQSFVTGAGQEHMDYLLDRYEAILQRLEISYEIDRSNQLIRLEGYGLYDILGGEVGLHLFYRNQQNPLPVRVLLEPESKQHKSLYHQVVRVYHQQILNDLRTGFNNTIHISTDEFMLLLFAGMPRSLRQEVQSNLSP